MTLSLAHYNQAGYSGLMNDTANIRTAIETGDVNAVRILASANGNMHGLWNTAMDAQYDGAQNRERMLYLLGRYDRFGFC